MKLNVLLIMDPWIRVPPKHYGGIERVVFDLAGCLEKRGHQVTLWAAPGSHGCSRVEPFGRESEWTKWSNFRNLTLLTGRLISGRRKYDVVHNFGRLAYLAGIFRSEVGKVQTYMRTVRPRNIRLVYKWGGRRIHFTSVSKAIRDTGLPGGGDWSVVYNCAPLDRYELRSEVDPATAPLVFLGRLERCKGVHTAISVARQLGRRLRIAGNISHLPDEQAYFKAEIEPHLDDHLITYEGPVDDVQKQELLGTAAAMLMPIEWKEPFPIVLPESLACGTPVIAFRRGGVPEGIEHGQTGFLCDTAQEMAHYVNQLGSIDRAFCREEAERRFSVDAITDSYLEIYRRLVDGTRRG